MIIIDNLAEPGEQLEFTRARTEYLLNQNLHSTISTVDGRKIFPYEYPGMNALMLSYGYGDDWAENSYHNKIKESSKTYQVHYLSQYVTDWHETMDAKKSMFFQSVQLAFNQHMNLSLDPDSIWYCIVHELAIHIEQNQDRYRGYFTVSDKKETIEIRHDGLYPDGPPEQWKGIFPKFMAEISHWVPRATVDLMLPRFSTTTEVKRLSLLALFMNILSNYYKVAVSTLCGIPSIRLEGTAEDWNRIVNHAELASKEFDGLKAYFDDLIPVLKEIAGVAGGQEPDPEFWRSIYKFQNSSGGGSVNGWITTLFAYHQYTDGTFHLKWSFDWRKTFMEESGMWAGGVSNHIKSTPFVWNYPGKHIDMLLVSGFMGMRYDRFLSPQLGYGVLEKQYEE